MREGPAEYLAGRCRRVPGDLVAGLAWTVFAVKVRGRQPRAWRRRQDRSVVRMWRRRVTGALPRVWADLRSWYSTDRPIGRSDLIRTATTSDPRPVAVDEIEVRGVLSGAATRLTVADADTAYRRTTTLATVRCAAAGLEKVARTCRRDLARRRRSCHMPGRPGVRRDRPSGGTAGLHKSCGPRCLEAPDET